MSTLKNCPLCDHALWMKEFSLDHKYAARCDGCGFHGPICGSKEEAIAAANRRPAPAAAPLGAVEALRELKNHVYEHDASQISINGRVDKIIAALSAPPPLSPSASEPIPMILHCPDCTARHIDDGEFATKPHHTHACQSCGMVWRPAIIPTVGVQFLPGFKNEPPRPGQGGA